MTVSDLHVKSFLSREDTIKGMHDPTDTFRDLVSFQHFEILCQELCIRVKWPHNLRDKIKA